MAMATIRKKRRTPRQRRERLGRNDPCWCGLGRKYKSCHLDRDTQTPVHPGGAFRSFRQSFTTSKTCLAPDSWLKECRGGISQAHTIQKSTSLKRIAQNGHVYSFLPPPNLEKLRENQSVLVPRLLGIQQASTFAGFCARHDDTIFAPLEKQTFYGTPEQCFLLGYRALAREIYNKRAAAKSPDIIRDMDKGKPLARQVELQEMASSLEVAIEAVGRDNFYYKSIYDDILERQDYNTVRAYIIEFETAPPVMCSGAASPGQDFDGVKLQNVEDLQNTPDLLCFTSFYGGERGVVAFSWLANFDRTCGAFIESLKAIPDKLVTAALLRFFFTHCENVHIAPDWWESLSEETRSAVIEHMMVNADPIKARPKAVLADDGEAYDPWPIVSRRLVQ